ncbi:MAG: hypothetical protein CO108_21380 [Deltaproteobacteria bacterium CG_4_9_14_3_um_filter_63_12]|nr:MAG: hypothetical protein CO108_21380 [Deltaproteobacteria bacterium CG_4_9_14_3_um_filter_63_12]
MKRWRGAGLRPEWTFFLRPETLERQHFPVSVDASRTLSLPGLGSAAVRAVAMELEPAGRLAVLQGDELRVGGWDGLEPTRTPIAEGTRGVAWHNGQVLLGGTTGLKSLDLATGAQEMLLDSPVSGLWPDSCGRVWVTTEGLHCLDGARALHPLSLRDKATPTRVKLGSDGRLLICVRDGGCQVYIPSTNTFDWLAETEELSLSDVSSSADGTLHAVLSSSQGQDSITRPGMVSILPNGERDNVYLFKSGEHLFEGLDGRMMVFAEGSVWVREASANKGWSKGDYPGPGDEHGGAAVHGSRGAILFGSRHGLARWLPDRRVLDVDLDAALDRTLCHRSLFPVDLSVQEMVLVPVLRAGWADGRFDKKERSELERQLVLLGHDAKSPLAQFCQHASQWQPSPAFFDRSLELLRAELAALGVDERHAVVTRVVALSTAIAGASGGFLGFGSKICSQEREFLEELKRSLE